MATISDNKLMMMMMMINWFIPMKVPAFSVNIYASASASPLSRGDGTNYNKCSKSFDRASVKITSNYIPRYYFTSQCINSHLDWLGLISFFWKTVSICTITNHNEMELYYYVYFSCHCQSQPQAARYMCMTHYEWAYSLFFI
jgi:hypothetical protein